VRGAVDAFPAFRDALREQQANLKFTELSFEDRLALLVDQECSQRRENRIRRNIHIANFPMQANLEEIDFALAVMLAGPELVAIDTEWFIAAGFPNLLAARSL